MDRHPPSLFLSTRPTEVISASTPARGRLVLAGLLGLALFVLRDVLFFGRSFFERDLLFVYFAEVEAFVRAVAEGALPLRDPSTGFGQAILGNPESQILYPLTWLHLILTPDRAFSLIVLVHFVVGATGAAVLCWRLSKSVWASFLAGAFWMVAGPFQSTLNLWHHFAGAIWMPWVLVAFDRLLERPVISRMLILGGVFGLQILAGSADLCAMTLLLALLRLVCEWRGLLHHSTPRALLMTFGAVCVAVTLGAGVWMPAWEIVRSSVRNELPWALRTAWSIHPLSATEMVLPTQLGALPFAPESTRLLTDGQWPFLKSLFLGPLVLPLMAVAFLNAHVPRRYRVFLALGALLAGLAALGRYTPVYDALTMLIPPLRLFRYPAKAAIPLSLLTSVIAAIGAASLSGIRERRVAVGVCTLVFSANAWLFLTAPTFLLPVLDASRPLMVATYLGRVEQGLFWSALSIAALAVSLLRGGQNLVRACVLFGAGVTLLINGEINPTIPNEVIRFRPAHLAAVRDTEPSRLYAFDYLHNPARSAEIFDRGSLIVPEKLQGVDPASAVIVVVRSALMPPTGGEWGIEYAWDEDLKGLFDRALRELTRHIHTVEGQPALVRMLQLANVSRVAALHTSGFDGLTIEHTLPMPLPEPLYIFRVPAPLPRAYAVSGARVLTTGQAEATILDPAFDPRTEVTLSEGASARVSGTFQATVAVAKRRSDRIEVDATLNEPGHVVLVDGFLPGWQGTVDGVNVPVRRANALFLAVRAPAGRHRIVFTYKPLSALVGASLTALTAIGLLIAWALAQVRGAQASSR